MQPLSLATDLRKDSSSARVLSVIPSGFLVSCVLRRLASDVVQGMTCGRAVVDANGQTRRLFLDVVGILGDTVGFLPADTSP